MIVRKTDAALPPRFAAMRAAALCLAFLLLFSGCSVFSMILPETQPDWENLPVSEPGPAQVNRYYYEQLSNTQKHAYNRILAEIENFPERIEIPMLTREDLNILFEALSYDNPRLLMLGTKSFVEQNGSKAYFKCDYRFLKQEYEEKAAQMDAAVRSILGKMEKNLSAWEKERYLHDALINGCEYKAGSPNESSPYGSLVEKKATCEGYARAMKLLMDEAGLRCYVICGTGMNQDNLQESHMWNIVQIDGAYYHLDPTWDDPVGQNSEQGQHYLYFNLSDAEISKTHSGFQSKNKCDASAANYYVKMGLFFSAYNSDTRSAMTQSFVKQLKDGKTNLDIRFKTQESYEQALDGLFKQQQVYRIFENANLSLQKKIATNNVQYIKNDELWTLSLFVQYK